MSLPPVPLEPTTSRIHSLDGLRAVSAGLVLVAHLGLEHIVPGGLGVTIFFFISGFIITRLLLAEIDRSGTIDLVAFYRRRFWRLWPAIAASVFGMMIVGAFFKEIWAPLDQVIGALIFMQNYWNVLSPTESPLNIHWSLAVEFHFYLIWPFFLLAILTRPGLALPAVTIALAGFLAFRFWTVFALKLGGLSWSDIDIWTYSLSHVRGDSILFGCLLAILAQDLRMRRMFSMLAQQHSIWIGGALLLVSLLLRDDLFRATARYSLQGVALFLVFSGVLFAERGGIVRWFLNLPVMVWLGTISFSIYLWHLILWRAVRQISGLESGLLPALTTAGLTLLVAWLSFRFVEQRFLALGKRRTAMVAA